jgi:Xaa-Pro dipeptidase
VSAGGTATKLDLRLDRLRVAAAKRGLDAVVATSDASIAYLTGFEALQLERLFAVVARCDGGGALVVPSLEEEAAEAAPTELDRVAYTPESNGLRELANALGNARAVGVEEDHMNVARARALEELVGAHVEPAGEAVMELRARKDAEEVELIRTACGTVADVLERMFSELHPGAVERAVNARVEYRLKERGATACHTLILFGANGSNPHGKPGDRPLAKGDVVCADASARIGGYWGDLTRCGTVGPPGEWARAAFAVVREAQAAAPDAAHAGVPARDVDSAQREVVEGASELGRCLHGAGHAMGVDVHEPPFLVPQTGTPLEEGMVLTIEPGLYQPGLGGIRLEDDILVTSGEPELLCRLPLELREIRAEERSMENHEKE